MQSVYKPKEHKDFQLWGDPKMMAEGYKCVGYELIAESRDILELLAKQAAESKNYNDLFITSAVMVTTTTEEYHGEMASGTFDPRKD
jgi:hypothetical protein